MASQASQTAEGVQSAVADGLQGVQTVAPAAQTADRDRAVRLQTAQDMRQEVGRQLKDRR